MRDFETDKFHLIQDIEIEIGKTQFAATLEKIKRILESIKTHSDLDGELSSLVIDELDKKIRVGVKIIDFENYFRDRTNLIKSVSLRQIAKGLQKSGIKISYCGRAWTEQHANWIYFDTVLNVEKLRNKYQLGAHIVIHENLDPKSGTEKGFIDEQTGEGLMGKIK
jgi:hypothetical protein